MTKTDHNVHTQDKCLFVVAGKHKQGINEHFKSLKAIFNGAGWFVEKKHQEDVQKICHEANLQCIDFPLEQSFESLRRSHKASFFKEKLIFANLNLEKLKNSLNVSDITNEALLQPDYKQKFGEVPTFKPLLEALDEINLLEAQITRVEEEERISNITLSGSQFSYLLENYSEKKLIEGLRKISPGISTGFKIGDIDLKIPGGQISICAAPTSHGKTTVLVNLALGALQSHPDKSVYFFTYEESPDSILCLFLNTYMDIELSKNNRSSIRTYFTEDKLDYITTSKQKEFLQLKNEFFANYISNGRLKIFGHNLATEELVSAIRYLAKNTNAGLVCIDYMQMLKLLKRTYGGRQEELKEICLQLKDCAIDTGLPILLAAQFNRSVVAEADLSPTNIREAGDIEQIANLIIGFWNRNFQGFSREGNVDKSGKKVEKEASIYMEILKGRECGNGHSAVLEFNGNTGKIKNKTVTSTFATSSRFG